MRHLLRFQCKQCQAHFRGWIKVPDLNSSWSQFSAQAHLDDPEAQVASVEHNDLVLIGTIVHDMPQSQQGGRVGKDCTPPCRVPFVGDHKVLFMRHDGFVEHSGVVVLIRRSEVVLHTEIPSVVLVLFWKKGK